MTNNRPVLPQHLESFYRQRLNQSFYDQYDDMPDSPKPLHLSRGFRYHHTP